MGKGVGTHCAQQPPAAPLDAPFLEGRTQREEGQISIVILVLLFTSCVTLGKITELLYISIVFKSVK